MKSKMIKILGISLLVIIMSLSVTGCRRDDPENGFDPPEGGVFVPPEFVYLPEIMPFPPLPDGLDQLDRVVVAGDTVFVTAWSFGDGEDLFSMGQILSMNIDGTNLAVLPNYNPGNAPPEAEGGHVQINNLHVDGDGNLWVVESGSFFAFDLPDDFVEDPEEPWHRWEYMLDLDSFNVVRKLDNTGAEILSLDITDIVADQEWFWVNDVAVDGDGNVYIATDHIIIVLASDGRHILSIDVQGWVDSLIALPDGTVAMFGSGEAGRELRLIDMVSGTLGDVMDLPQNVFNIFAGSDEYMFLLNNHMSLFGFNPGDEEPSLILNWLDTDITTDGLGNITFLDDGRLMLTTQRWGVGDMSTDVVFLTRTPYADLPQRTTLTLATFWLDWNVRNAIIEFNRTSTTHRIQVIDYSQYNTEDDWQAGLTRLSTDLITGRIPDILDVSGLPYQQYMARGLLADMYTFIDADPEISRDDLMEPALRATEMDGKLPFVFPSFTISTIIGSTGALGTNPGWTMDEFRAVLAANPQADMPMGQWLTRESFLNMSFMLGMDNFVDWSTGTAHFGDGEFATLLEIANTFPPTLDEMDREFFVEETELIATGRQIMSFMSIGNVTDLQRFMFMYGGDIIFMGFPAEDRNGNTMSPSTTLAITSSAVDPDGAWSFVRTFLTYEWQEENLFGWGFPTNRARYDAMIFEAMNPPEGQGDVMIGWGDGMMFTLEPLTQVEADQIYRLINSVRGTWGTDDALWEIISEVAEEFFNGQRTAADAARIIQNRAAIYVSERS